MKIGIIGVGNMGGAIVQGLINSEDFNNNKLHLYNRTFTKLDKYQQDNINVHENVEEVLKEAQVIILGIKPNMYEKWLKEYSLLIQDKLFISIGAGITSSFLSNYLKLFMITMPNMGSQIQKGYTVICNNSLLDIKLNEVMLEETAKIFKQFGKVKIIEEQEIENYIGLIGSAPAYFMELVKMMSEYFTKQGYNLQEVEQTLAYIMETSALIIQNNSQQNTEQLVDSVCSKGGATIEAINNMKNSSLEEILYTSIEKCIQKAKDMKEE
ncbi:MAG: pyrroline-5-carboxylate reductase family protein [Mycoplasmatales bacterium]